MSGEGVIPALPLIAFVERDCTIGGGLCPAWAEWFQGCEDADPKCIDEDRDPLLLTAWPFNPLACERPDICKLYRAGIRRIERAEAELQ